LYPRSQHGAERQRYQGKARPHYWSFWWVRRSYSLVYAFITALLHLFLFRFPQRIIPYPSKLPIEPTTPHSIGRAISRQLVLQELDLALHYSTNLLAIEELVAQLRKDHEIHCPEAGYLRISIHQADLSVADECVKLCENVAKEHGRSVDILVSNAGFGKRITDIWLVFSPFCNGSITLLIFLIIGTSRLKSSCLPSISILRLRSSLPKA
jgi:hypothetical protein